MLFGESESDSDGRMKPVHERIDLVLKNLDLSSSSEKTFIHFKNEIISLLKDARSRLTGNVKIDSMIERCVRTMATKGAEYTVGSEDRLANFRGVSQDVGIPMEKAWYVFFNKHLRAIQSYIKNGCRVKSEEGITGRIMDCIVYLLLFYLLSIEKESSGETIDRWERDKDVNT
jgi:hypothetical protein